MERDKTKREIELFENPPLIQDGDKANISGLTNKY